MHVNYQVVCDAVSLPVVDVRDAMVSQLTAMGASSLSPLGTKYVMQDSFYPQHLEGRGVTVVKPLADEIDDLQSMIYGELTQGVVTEISRNRFLAIAQGCRSRGGSVIGLCCTEFGMLVNADNAPWRFIDSTYAHVKALLEY
jgi:aspartate racemase